MPARPVYKSYMLTVLLSMLFTAVFFINASGAPLRDVPQTLTQPDGTIVHCFASGDEYHNWLHDEDGFTIIQDPESGFYVYAKKTNGRLVATNYIAGKSDPRKAGLQPNANISADQVMQKRNDFNELMADVHRQEFGGIAKSLYQQASIDEMNNIVIFIRFSDDDEFDQEVSFYDSLYNMQGEGVYSLYEYYQEASYNQFSIYSHLFPESAGTTVVSYQDPNPRAYYEPKSETNEIGYDPGIATGNATDPDGRTYREHTLLRNAIEYVESQIPAGLSIDNNNNGHVDCVSFIIRGGPEGWNTLLWPHRWVLWSQDVAIHGKRVWDYTFQLEEGQNSNTIRLGTIAHEMFHILGAPDLYRYDNSGLQPVGPWDLMAQTSMVPQHMGAYMKYYYGGWIEEIPEITATGTYELNPVYAHDENCYKIASPHSHNEFFVVEYRKTDSIYDNILPGDGLIVYRVNRMAEGFGNHYAPDEVYIYRPDGTLTTNGSIQSAYLSADVGRIAIDDNTSLSAFLSDGSPGGLMISNIGSAGQTISFDVTVEYESPSIIRHDRGDVFTGMGTGSESNFQVAIRLTGDDLDGLYGRALSAVHVYIRNGGVHNVRIKIWEDGSFGDPGNMIYDEPIGDSLKLDAWSEHILNEPVTLSHGAEYWIGYEINTSGGHPAGIDGGPVADGKGAWINPGNGWQQLHELNSVFNSNFRIRGVVGATPSTSVPLAGTPEEAALYQNYPNPFNPSTVIRYAIPVQGHVKLEVYNTLGQVVRKLIDEEQTASSYEVIFDGSNLPSGVYYYRLQINNSNETFEQTKRLVLLK